MNDRRIFDSWNKIEPDNAADARMLESILTRKRKYYEKKEQCGRFVICLIQIALFVLTLSIAAILIVNQGIIIFLFIIGYVLIGGFISVIMAFKSKTKYYDYKEEQYL